MVTGITERNQMKTELANLGYSLKYIDDWQPKTTLYRHRPAYNDEGEVTDAIGTAVRNVPGNPDYVLRKARIGLFPWIPDEKCECQWCVERRPGPTDQFVRQAAENVSAMADSGSGNNTAQAVLAKPLIGIYCPVCNVEITAASRAGAQSHLRAHAKTH